MSDDRDARILAALGAALVGQLVQTRADLMERIDRLQDALTAQHDDDAADFGAT